MIIYCCQNSSQQSLLHAVLSFPVCVVCVCVIAGELGTPRNSTAGYVDLVTGPVNLLCRHHVTEEWLAVASC